MAKLAIMIRRVIGVGSMLCGIGVLVLLGPWFAVGIVSKDVRGDESLWPLVFALVLAVAAVFGGMWLAFGFGRHRGRDFVPTRGSG